MKDRREFLKKSASITALGLISNWASAIPTSDKLGEVLPKRQLIRNGEKVTSFCQFSYELHMINFVIFLGKHTNIPYYKHICRK